jgi:CDP-glycerol glycerophosphotransferase (TagB/SpsB family)
VIPFLAKADVLVTDASSVQLEYLAVDRPMVLINNPQRFGCKDFDPAGFEWSWRDMGEEVNDGEDVLPAVAAAFADPKRRAARRERYRKLMFGDLTDGRTAERLAANVGELKSLLPMVAAQYVASWPLRRARGVKRRVGRLFSGFKTRATA